MANSGKKRTVKVGVTDFYVAKATYADETGKVTYDTPRVFGGTATVSASVNKNANKIYESDELIRNRNRISDVDITYTSRTVDLKSEMEVMYGITDNESNDYTVGPDDEPGHWAVGWGRRESDGSYTCIWYLWTEPSKGEESDETATESESSNTESYSFSASSSPERRADNKSQMKRIKKCANATEMQAFFATVLAAE